MGESLHWGGLALLLPSSGLGEAQRVGEAAVSTGSLKREEIRPGPAPEAGGSGSLSRRSARGPQGAKSEEDEETIPTHASPHRAGTNRKLPC